MAYLRRRSQGRVEIRESIVDPTTHRWVVMALDKRSGDILWERTAAEGVPRTGRLRKPIFLQFIFGIMGGIGAELDHLMHMKSTADRLFGEDYVFSVLAAGRHQMNFTTQAAMMGGSVRVGLEDSLYISKGKLAESNAQQVAKIRRICEDLSLEIATPDEAREILDLKGGDMVKF